MISLKLFALITVSTDLVLQIFLFLIYIPCISIVNMFIEKESGVTDLGEEILTFMS